MQDKTYAGCHAPHQQALLSSVSQPDLAPITYLQVQENEEMLMRITLLLEDGLRNQCGRTDQQVIYS